MTQCTNRLHQAILNSFFMLLSVSPHSASKRPSQVLGGWSIFHSNEKPSSLMESSWQSTSPRPSRRSELTTDRERCVTSWGSHHTNGHLLSAPSEWINSLSHPPMHLSMFSHRPESKTDFFLLSGMSDHQHPKIGPYLGGGYQGRRGAEPLPGSYLQGKLGGCPDAVIPPRWFGPDRRYPAFVQPPSIVPPSQIGAFFPGLAAPMPPYPSFGPPLVAPLLPGLWPTPPASFWASCSP